MCLLLLFWLKAQTQNEALQAIYHSKHPRKREQKCLVEVAARAAARTGHLMLLQTVQMLLSQGRAGTGGCYHTSGRDTAKVTHCR